VKENAVRATFLLHDALCSSAPYATVLLSVTFGVMC